MVIFTVPGLVEAAPINKEPDVQQVHAEVVTDQPQVEVPPERTVKEEVKEEVAQNPPPAPKPKPTLANWQQLLQQAGIPEHEWAAANEIITRESGWRHLAWNSQGSGAYGLCQSLPASKMASAGADYMTNPVTQLKWCHKYAQGYGGWVKAAEYSRCVGKCYSTRVKAYVYKDHAWW